MPQLAAGTRYPVRFTLNGAAGQRRGGTADVC